MTERPEWVHRACHLKWMPRDEQVKKAAREFIEGGNRFTPKRYDTAARWLFVSGARFAMDAASDLATRAQIAALEAVLYDCDINDAGSTVVFTGDIQQRIDDLQKELSK